MSCTLRRADGVRPESPKQPERRRRVKAPLRTKSIGTKVSEEEFVALEATARAADMTLSEWVRTVLLAAPGVGLPDDEAAIAGRVTLAEVLALRTLFLNLQFRQAQGPL